MLLKWGRFKASGCQWKLSRSDFKLSGLAFALSLLDRDQSRLCEYG